MSSKCGRCILLIVCSLLFLSTPDSWCGPVAGLALGFEPHGARTHLKGWHSLGENFPDAAHQVLDHLQHIKQRADAKSLGNSSGQMSLDAHLQEEDEEIKAPKSILHSEPGEREHSSFAHADQLPDLRDHSSSHVGANEQQRPRRSPLDVGEAENSADWDWTGLSDDKDPGKRASLSASIRLQQVSGGVKPVAPAPVAVSMVLLLTLLMAACNGLGAIPFFFTGSLSKEWAGLANAVACGVMLAASFDLIHEGEPHGPGLTILGLILGGAFIQATQQWLGQFEHVRFEGLQGAGARKTLLMVCIMAAHALGEGSGVGVSFCGDRGWAQGLLVTMAIGLHNIPEGLAVATVLVGKGVSVRQAVLWTLLTALPQPLVAVPAYLFVDSFRSLLPLALGFAAGCMVWMVFAELLPDALADAPHARVATAGTLSAAWLEALRMMLSSLERPDGTFAPPVNVDFRTVAPACFYLLLPILPALFTSGAFSLLPLPRGALSLGLAAGLLMWMGAAEAGLQLFNPHLRTASTLLFSIAGGALLLLLWRAYGSATPPRPGNAPSKKSDEDLEAPLIVIASAGPPIAPPFSASSGTWDGQPHANGHAVDADEGGRFASKRSLPRRPVAASALPSRPSLDGPGPLPVSSAALYSQRSTPLAPSPRSSAFNGLSYLHSAQVAGLGLLLVLAQGVPEGWLLGSLAREDPSTALISVVPASLRGILKAVACMCLMKTWPGLALGRRLAVATLAAAIAPAVACARILVDNKVLQPATALHQALQLAGRGEALVGGALLVAAAWKLYPAAEALQGRAARRGLLLGLLGSAGVYTLLGMLCLLTPFCLNLGSSASPAHIR
eukprot:jgi/Botrbrau1/16568/Bobra.0262s0005.1